MVQILSRGLFSIRDNYERQYLLFDVGLYLIQHKEYWFNLRSKFLYKILLKVMREELGVVIKEATRGEQRLELRVERLREELGVER